MNYFQVLPDHLHNLYNNHDGGRFVLRAAHFGRLSPVSKKRKTWSKIILSIVRKDQGSLLLPNWWIFKKGVILNHKFTFQIFLSSIFGHKKRNNSTMSLQNTPQKRASRPFETFLKTHPFRKGNVSLSINSGKLSFYQNRIIVWSLSLYKFFGGVSFGSKTKAAKKIILQKVSPYLTHIKNLLVGNNWFYTLYFWHPEL